MIKIDPSVTSNVLHNLVMMLCPSIYGDYTHVFHIVNTSVLNTTNFNTCMCFASACMCIQVVSL
jgi:hypothetical protein